MHFVTALIPVVVYLIIAGLAGTATKATRVDHQDFTTFPIQKHVRILVWFGGLVCVAIGAYGILSRDHMASSLSFLGFGLICPFLPLKPVVISPSEVKSIAVFPWRGTSIRWNEVERVESWKGARLTAVVKGNTAVTHTRFHVDHAEFIRQLRLHVAPDKWIDKESR